MFVPKVIKAQSTTALAGILDLTDLRRFVLSYRKALTNAAALLAGARGVRSVESLAAGLTESAEPSRRTWAALRDLLGILTLEHVHDPDREECALFAALDPTDHRVEEICLLTDGLRDVLEQILSEQPEVLGQLQPAA